MLSLRNVAPLPLLPPRSPRKLEGPYVKPHSNRDCCALVLPVSNMTIKAMRHNVLHRLCRIAFMGMDFRIRVFGTLLKRKLYGNIMLKLL
jgi:hypothetical protein